MAAAPKEYISKLERQLEAMRTPGIDLSAKQQEIEGARRAAGEADTLSHEAQEKEREAQFKLDNQHRSMQSMEQEPAKLPMFTADVQSRYEQVLGQLRDLDDREEFESKYLREDLQGYAKAVLEADVSVAELEPELEAMRTRGLDLSAKQQEIEVAMSAAQETNAIFHDCLEICEGAVIEAQEKEREAMEARFKLDNQHRSMHSMEEEPAKLQIPIPEIRSKADAQSRCERVLGLLRDLDNRDEYGSEDLSKGLQDRARTVEEAEELVAELERELEAMRNRGLDPSAKQGEIEVAMRAAQEATSLFHRGLKICEVVVIEAQEDEREAMEAQSRLGNQRSCQQEAEGSVAQEPPIDYSMIPACEAYKYKVLNAAMGFFGMPDRIVPGAAESAEAPVTSMGENGIEYTYLPSDLEAAEKLSPEELIADMASRREKIRKYDEFTSKMANTLAEFLEHFAGITVERPNDIA